MPLQKFAEDCYFLGLIHANSHFHKFVKCIICHVFSPIKYSSPTKSDN